MPVSLPSAAGATLLKYCSTSAIRFSRSAVVAAGAAAGAGAGAGAAAAGAGAVAGAGAAAVCAQDELVLKAMAVVVTTAAERRLRQM